MHRCHPACAALIALALPAYAEEIAALGPMASDRLGPPSVDTSGYTLFNPVPDNALQILRPGPANFGLNRDTSNIQLYTSISQRF